MNKHLCARVIAASMASAGLFSAASAGAAASFHVSTFATGAAVSATGPDTVSLGRNSLWAAYTNGVSSTGQDGGSSTVVHYDLDGTVLKTYSILGSVDGMKVDPSSGLVWVLQNQDGNSTLTLLDIEENTVSEPIPYAVTSATRGIDDVAFRAGKAFISYTNPAGPQDAVIELVQEDSNPIVVTPILQAGATGTDLATGKVNQPAPLSDPDSLKVTPDGDLMLTSGGDGSLTFVEHPGTERQLVSFLHLLDQSKQPLSSIDDAYFVTARKGTFFVSDTGNNRILKIEATNMTVGTLFVASDGANEFGTVDLKTGVVTPAVGVTGLSKPHGIAFLTPGEHDKDHDGHSCHR